MKKTIIFILLILVSACSSKNEGLDKLKELCEKDAGLTIYKTVKADGYYNAYSDSGLTNGLIKGPYSFYEFCNDTPSLSRNAFFPEAGCFRVSKVERSINTCYQRIDKRLSKFKVKPYPEFLKKSCIAVKKTEKPMARYKFSIISTEVNRFYSEYIMKYEFYIDDLIKNKTISHQVDYTFFAKGRTLPSYSCHHIINNFERYSIADFIKNTIK